MPQAGRILLADDDEDFALLLQTAFEYTQIPEVLTVVRDGAEAISYLKGEGIYADRASYPLPLLLLLDLNLPRMNGFEVLRWIRCQPQLNGLTVVIFTGADIDAETELAMQLGANSHLVKPLGFNELVETAKQLQAVWLEGGQCRQARQLRS